MRHLLLAFVIVPPAFAETPRPSPTSPAEPLANRFSAHKAAEFIDGASLHWTRDRKCFSCHTNVFYMMARPLVRGGDAEPLAELRAFLEKQVQSWEAKAPGTDFFVLTAAFALSTHDAATTGKLHPLTRQALDRSIKLQHDDGGWDWPRCDWPPLEHDSWYGVGFMAVAYGQAPGGYRDLDHVKPALEKIRGYVKANPAPDLHHRLTLLWASQKVDGLLTADQQKAAVTELMAAQRPDGGWSLPALSNFPKRRNGKPNDPDAPSDGYATGYAVYVARQAGVPADDPALRKAVAWIKANQRESGRWFTRSLKVDHTDARAHLIANAGSVFCVLALHACGEPLGD